MDNPLGGIRRGWDEISRAYNRIFSGAGVVKVEFFDYTLHASDQTFLAVGRERGSYKSAGQEIELMIRTSRWFKLADGRWRQLHHHGSIEDADLLARYQLAVR
jgi:ketosteroid isomerase-like protein